MNNPAKTFNEYYEEIEQAAKLIEDGKVSPEQIPLLLKKAKENSDHLRRILRETSELSQSILHEMS